MPSLVNQFNFVDRSWPDAASWAWDFGDGVGTSAARNPSYTFPSSAALYLARLRATTPNACGPNPVSSTVWRPVGVRGVNGFPKVIVTGVTYAGGLKWFGFYPYTYTTYDGVNVPERYLLKTGSGTESRDEYVSDYTTAVIGHVTMSVGGSLTVNYMTGAVTGRMAGTEGLIGNFCNGLSWRGSYGGSTATVYYAVYGSTIETFLVAGGLQVLTPTTKRYVCGTLPTGKGYVVTYCGSGVWGTGQLVETLANRMTLGQAALAGGGTVVATTYRSVVNTYNPGTSSATGEFTALAVGYADPNVSGDFLVTLKYSVVPIGGGVSTTLTQTYVEAVGVGGYLDLHVEIPNKTGYTVALQSADVQDIAEFIDDAEQLDDDSYYGGNLIANYVTAPEWTPQLPAFQADGPSEFFDDGEDLVDGVQLSLVGGNYWLESGLLAAFDIPGEFWDDGEGYADADPLWETEGQGWLEWGFFTTADYRPSMDDGESYADGSLTDADGDLFNWMELGTFQLNDYAPFVDDGETYSDGSLVVTNGGDDWTQNGTFQVN